MNANRRESLLKEYTEVCGNFRLLTDIRFRLLALLPIAAAAAAALRGDSTGVGSFSLSLFGLVATIGLATYNARNDQLYNELVMRASTIERSLGLPDGSFANRPRAWLEVPIFGKSIKVNHSTGVYIIYIASTALWLAGLLVPLIEWVREEYVLYNPPLIVVQAPAQGVNFIALIGAFLLTYLYAALLRRHDKRIKSQLRIAAADAVRRAEAMQFADIRTDSAFLNLCTKLAGADSSATIARADYYAHVDKKSLGYYLLSEPPTLARGAQLVALLTDMSPTWLFDCATNRRGESDLIATEGDMRIRALR